jgi:hypothetical protein
MKEEQKLAPTILNFNYKTSQVYKKTPCIYNSGHVTLAHKGDGFEKLENVDINKECALVTELYDSTKGNYMYMFQNVVDPINKGSTVYQTLTADFDDDCKYAVVFEKGERSIVKLKKGGKLTLKHAPGHATYVIPY